MQFNSSHSNLIKFAAILRLLRTIRDYVKCLHTVFSFLKNVLFLQKPILLSQDYLASNTFYALQQFPFLSVGLRKHVRKKGNYRRSCSFPVVFVKQKYY